MTMADISINSSHIAPHPDSKEAWIPPIDVACEPLESQQSDETMEAECMPEPQFSGAPPPQPPCFAIMEMASVLGATLLLGTVMGASLHYAFSRPVASLL